MLVSWFLIVVENVYPVYDLIRYEKLYSRHFGRGLLFKLCEYTWNHCKEYPSEDCGIVQSSYGLHYIH
jgi:hypothetical protein